MAKVSEVYAGNYVSSAELLAGKRIAAFVFAASTEAVGQDQTLKIVLSLSSTDGRT